MPIREYRCQKCKHRFETIEKMSDKPAQVCPKCKGPVKRLVSSPAIQFKGSGFYITDYAHKNSPSFQESRRKESSGEKTPEKKSETPKAETPKKEPSSPSSD